MKTFVFALLALSFAHSASASENCNLNLKINGHFSARHVTTIVGAIEAKGYTVEIEGSDSAEGAEATYQGEIDHGSGLKGAVMVAIHKGDNYLVNAGAAGKLSVFGNNTTNEVLEQLQDLPACPQP